MQKKLPNFSYEQKYWQNNNLVIGADEVGRGSFAGPLITAAVILPPKIKLEVEINDSKKLSPRKREIAALWLKQNAISYAYGKTSVSFINKNGIVKATHRAFRQSLSILISQYPNIFLLIDAFYVPYLAGIPRKNQLAIIKGDSLSLSIASASILAKVHRDYLMTKLSKSHKVYAWDKNKGYGTAMHREAIKKYGLTPHHRISFIH
jgi:ribonuclease HII